MCVLHVFGARSDIDTDCKLILHEISIKERVQLGWTDPSIIVEPSICSSSEAAKKAAAENEKQTGSMEPPPLHFNSHPTDKAAD